MKIVGDELSFVNGPEQRINPLRRTVVAAVDRAALQRHSIK